MEDLLFIEGSKLTIDELVKNIKNAFNIASRKGSYCDTYIYAGSCETGQVIITLSKMKPDLSLLKAKLKDVFEDTSFDVDCKNKPGFLITINRRSVM